MLNEILCMYAYIYMCVRLLLVVLESPFDLCLELKPTLLQTEFHTKAFSWPTFRSQMDNLAHLVCSQQWRRVQHQLQLQQLNQQVWHFIFIWFLSFLLFQFQFSFFFWMKWIDCWISFQALRFLQRTVPVVIVLILLARPLGVDAVSLRRTALWVERRVRFTTSPSVCCATLFAAMCATKIDIAPTSTCRWLWHQLHCQRHHQHRHQQLHR